MNANTTPTITTIPLNKLVASDSNVRRTDADKGIAELAASIEAIGLRQNLNVRPSKGGKHEVVAGQRRLLALQYLLKKKKISPDHPVSCIVLDKEQNAEEISLAENQLREAMHPYDQFMAFNDLVVNGMPVEDVAARFGVTPTYVKRMMKMSTVSPKLLKIYRAGEMTLEHVMALTLTDDKKHQEKVWASLNDWQRDDADAIKSEIIGEATASTKRLGKFVGIEAYEAAGGKVIRDLFDDAGTGYMEDCRLLQRLATERLEAEAAKLTEEGWGWVKPSFEHHDNESYGRLKPTKGKADSADATYSKEKMKGAGAKVRINWQGELEIERGLLPLDTKKAKGAQSAGADDAPTKQRPEYSAKLVDELAYQRTAALRLALSQDAALALTALTHAVVSDVFYNGLTRTALHIHATSVETDMKSRVPSPEECSAQAELAARYKAWQERLPDDEAYLFAWLVEQERQTVTDLLVFTTALTVNATVPHSGHEQDRRRYADDLARRLNFDMANYWEPTSAANGFIRRLSKAQMAKAMTEAGCEQHKIDHMLGFKKDDAAVIAASELKGKCWLPTPLKTPEGK